MKTEEILCAARAAVPALRGRSDAAINAGLRSMAQSLLEQREAILAQNAADVEAARGHISDVMIDRLRLDEKRVQGMADGVLAVAELPSPIGRVLERIERPNGLVIEKVSVPLGVIAIIYESRPNVTSDAAALALKSGNVCILRSGKEAYCSAKAISEAMRDGLERVGLPRDALLLIDDTTRESARQLMTAKGTVDLLIPRGGAGLIRACVENATVPCLETGTGICHIYVDRDADCEKALNIIENAKASRPSVCNAAEVCLVHRDIAPRFLPMLEKRLRDDRLARGQAPVELRCCAEALPYVREGVLAGERDFDTEFLDYILAVGVVGSVEEAVSHIARHSTAHSESIVTENPDAAAYFTANVDSAAVYVNASTRFTDGGEFGLGCEMGISTQKLHARGPLGLKELTTYKYIVHGSGQIR